MGCITIAGAIVMMAFSVQATTNLYKITKYKLAGTSSISIRIYDDKHDFCHRKFGAGTQFAVYNGKSELFGVFRRQKVRIWSSKAIYMMWVGLEDVALLRKSSRELRKTTVNDWTSV